MRLKGGARSKMEGAHNDKKSKITTITANCELHPLIHTRPRFTLTQDMDLLQYEEKKTPPALCQWGSEKRGIDKEVVLSC